MPIAGGLGAMYVPGITSLIQGDIPFLDSEIPSVNAVVTARGLAKMYGALANGGRIDGTVTQGPAMQGDAEIRAEDPVVDKKIKSICKGC